MTQFERDIEEILREQFPSMVLIDGLGKVAVALAKYNGQQDASEPLGDEWPRMKLEYEKARAEYAALPSAQVAELAKSSRQRAQQAAVRAAAQHQARADAEKAATEQARFYNQHDVAADFAFWSKADYWTVDEAAALLLGRDPRKVNPDTLGLELSKASGLFGAGGRPARSKFHDSFDDLRTLLGRAESLGAPRLIPAALLPWADRKGYPVPPGLLAAFGPQAELGPADPVASIERGRGTATRWTDEKRNELRAFRDKHGAKAASEKFGITTQRVRQLVPTGTTKPKKATPFDGLMGLKK